ncbi:hypothetical protein B0H17DRAFT_1028149 [Mycena rosella]|uniref:Uncharacterized protein n=1 Tax=Mycena rosella TaxID=1033263 RepID=A0AAD7H101_MYCRO|nr:hypothetical protein B0H17DRAFT_1028149 [Mycena rosella]
MSSLVFKTAFGSKRVTLSPLLSLLGFGLSFIQALSSSHDQAQLSARSSASYILMPMSSVIFKTAFGSKRVTLSPLLSLLGFGLSFIQALSSSRDQAQLSASFSPSRASGPPTPSFEYQNNVPSWTLVSVISLLIITGLAIGAWIRSPGLPPRAYGRLRKGPPPPPPPPPPPQALPPANVDDEEDKDDDDADANDGGGDDEPQQDAGAENEDALQEDDLAVAGAPAPDDPPPPPGGVEEDDNDDDDFSASDGGVSWLLLLLFGNFVLGLFTRTQGYGTGNVKPANVQLGTAKPNPSAQSTSATIPGLLERQLRVVEGDPAFEMCAVPPPPSFIAGLLQRRSPPSPVVPPLPLLPQQALDVPVPLATHSLAPVPRQGRLLPLWVWKTYFLLALLPGLALVGAVVRLLLVLRPIRIPGPEHVPEAPLPEDEDEDGVVPEQPPPEPVQAVVPEPPPIQQQEHAPLPPNTLQATRKRIRLALLQHKEHGEGERVVRAQALQLLRRTTARRVKEPVLDEDTDRKQRREVREVQQRVWRQLCELTVRGEDEA